MMRKCDSKITFFIWTPKARSERRPWLTRLRTYVLHETLYICLTWDTVHMSYMRHRTYVLHETPYICLTWDTRVTIIYDNAYWWFQTEVELIVTICIACLVVEIIQSWILSSAEPLWTCIKVKVIEMTMSIIYPMHKSTVMPSLNAIA